MPRPPEPKKKKKEKNPPSVREDSSTPSVSSCERHTNSLAPSGTLTLSSADHRLHSDVVRVLGFLKCSVRIAFDSRQHFEIIFFSSLDIKHLLSDVF